MSQETTTSTKKKLGLFACIATGIGAIIGSGIFGSLPTVINDIGPAVILAFIAATVYTIAKMFPAVYSSAIIPASGSFFLMPTKLIHPVVGLYMAIQNLLQPVLISVFAVLFSDYFCSLIPSQKGKETMVAIIVLLIYTVLAYMGNYLFASINSLIVVVLMVAIGLYVFVGLGNMIPGQLTLDSIFHGGIKLTSFAAAVSVLASSLSGGTTISQIADDVKNPRRDIPLALILSPALVAVIYILMAAVTLGCMPGDTVTTLDSVATTFMSKGMVTFFVVGGPMCGVLTSMVPVIMHTCAQIQAAVDNDVFPKFLGKKNKNGVCPMILAYTMLFAILSAATGAGFGVLMTVFSAVNALSDIPTCIVPFYLRKKYPHACNHPGVSFPFPLVAVMAVFAAVLAAYLSFAAFASLGIQVWGLILGFMALAVVYFIFRIRYLKQHGRDLMAELKVPYQPWEEREAACKAMDEAK